MAAENLKVYFVDGVVLDKERCIIAASWVDSPGAFSSTILIRMGSNWSRYDVPSDSIVSLAVLDGQCFALGEDGLILILGEANEDFTADRAVRNVQEFHLSDVSERGSMERIRTIGKEVYACGWGGQVYRFANGKWEHFEDGVEDPWEDDFRDICGFGKDEIYLFGMHGRIYRYDGKKWNKVDSPTNAHISSAICVAPDLVYFCGADGTLFSGKKDVWEYIGDDEFQLDFWSIAEFQTAVYMTFSNGLARFKDGVFEIVDLGLEKPPTMHRIDSNDGVMWSFGEIDLLEFDGSGWKTVICPENQ